MNPQVLRRFVETNVDALLTAAALALGVLTSLSFGPSHPRSTWELAFTLIAWVPLLVRTRWPLAVAAVVMVLDAVHIGIAAHHHPTAGMIPAATMLALYTVMVRRAPRLAWAAAAAAATVQFAVGITSPLATSTALLYLNWPLFSAVLGRLIAERRARIDAAEQRAAAAEASKEAEAQRQVTAERIRIAHELHDVLAHHIAGVNAQAGVAQYLLRSDPDAAEKALAGITENSRAALEELRATLGLLRSDSDGAPGRGPTPGAVDIPRLVATHQDAGVHIELRQSGTARSLPTAADLALYRILQEALTNATKHAPGASVSVGIDWHEATVALTVGNSRPARAAEGLGTGNGLIGMRERAVAAGGTLTAQPTPDGGFAVVACLPAPRLAGSDIPSGTAQEAS